MGKIGWAVALLSINTVDKVGWTGNTESLVSIKVSSRRTGKALTVLEKGSVTWAVLADSSVTIPDLVVTTSKTFRTIIIWKIFWAVALFCVHIIHEI